MKHVALVLPALLSTGLAAAQRGPAPVVPATGATPAAFVPTGYALLDEARADGDLNQDGRPDVALVLRPGAEDAPDYDGEIMPGRVLLVLLATPRGYALGGRADHALLSKDGGGMYGDPFAGLTIARGVLSVDHYGGSSWRWGITSKFRYQQGTFYLIGETTVLSRTSGDCDRVPGSPGGEYHDTNFVTGAYEVRKISEDCRLLVNRRGRTRPAPLRRLADYAPVP